MEQFDQLLTCCICLDRYRTPKLLPCQHSYCLDPCMEGLVDYVKRQVKCPECRAEHRIPYNGIQGFPTNYTLTKFLELHADITGELPDPNADSIMSRCNVCSEKAYVNLCAHCDKKCCDTCRDAHADILKREISRINNQIKRGVHKIEDALSQVERNQSQLKSNADQVVTEIDEIQRRLSNALKERTDYLKSSVDKYVVAEMNNMKELKDNLELEVTNIQSNSDLMDKNLDDGTKWDDVELLDCKDIFIKMMDWIRNFDTSSEEYNRKIRFTSHDTVNDLAKKILEIGDLRMMDNKTKDNDDFESRSSGLSRSKSDHRLVSEFRRQEETNSPPVRRRFGENRYSREANKSRTNFGRFGGEEEEEDTTSSSRSSRFRSRFLRGDDEDEGDRRKSLHLDDEEKLLSKRERNKVIETEDASRGPLSGCIRLADSSRVIQRLKEREMELLRPKKKDTPPPAPKPAPRPAPVASRPSAASAGNDDEIDRIKKDNKAKEATQTATETTTASPTSATPTATSTVSSTTTATTAAATPATAAPVPATRRASMNQPVATTVAEPTTPVRPSRSSMSSTPATTAAAAGAGATAMAADSSKASSSAVKPKQTGSMTGSRYASRTTSPNSIVSRYAQPQASAAAGSGYGAGAAQKPDSDSDFSDSDTDSSSDSDSDDSDEDAAEDGYEYEYYDEEEPAAAAAVATTSRTSAPSSILKKSTDTTGYGSSSYGAAAASSASNDNYSSYGGYGAGSSSSQASGGHSSQYGYGASSSQPDTPGRNQSAYGASSSSSYSRGDDQPAGRSQKAYGGAKTTSSYGGSWGQETEPSHPISPSAGRRFSRYGSPEPVASTERRFSREDSSDSASGFSGRYKRRDDSDSFVSRYLAKSRSTAVGLGSGDATRDETPEESVSATKKISGEIQYPSGRSRYAALKERKARLAKSKSSATIGLGDHDDDEDDGDEVLTPFTSRFGGELARSRSSHMLKDQSSPSGSRASDASADDENLSSWAKYLKNKYGGRGAASASQGPSRESEDRRSRLGLGSRYENDQSKNLTGSPAPTPQQALAQGSAGIGSMPKSQYLQKQALVLKFGARGSQPGFFTWPRGIAVGADNTIIVADSSNHRVQIFDEHGQTRFWLGGYGNGEGEFDCLAGVAVNRIGQYIIADRYNHRIQIFDPSGQFIRTFGSQGTGNGQFNYPWGICTDALGFIFVCDKENHRVQVFQSDGTFVAKFGTMGNKPGQLEHPHYIAVSNTNRVIVSDSNNHRLQIFDVNGKVLTTFGSEGTDEGQFKFPRGVAVDEQGFIFVADSGNNRIQIFNPDGTFLRSFGRWGQSDGEFKGLEGIAVNAAGNILVADRENHRIQIF